MHENNNNENENNIFDVIDKQILPRYQRSKYMWTTEELIEELSAEVLFLKLFLSLFFCLCVFYFLRKIFVTWQFYQNCLYIVLS